ncbi:MAG: T9SS type A sorting domain-containing protein, partial [Saprospiraceae bacterium]|nr:T9SS type A sorting domain-containing protein [Saprospiraceae bacterium]
TPLWSHLIYNPNYIVVDTPNTQSHYGNAYSSIGYFANSIDVKGDYVYYVTGTHDDNVVNDGFGIYKVNYKTGELLWGDIYNAASGAPGYFTAKAALRFRKDGDIELIGNRKIDPEGWNNYPMSYRRVYSDEKGEVLQMHYDTSNQSVVPNRGGAFNGRNIILEEDSLYLQLYIHSEIPYLCIDAVTINGTQDSIKLIQKINVPFDQTITYFSFRAFDEVFLNDSIWVLLAKIEAFDRQKEKDKMELFYINYKNLDNIHLERRVDVTNYAFYNPLGNNFEIVEDEGDVVIIGIYHDYTLEKDQQNYYVRINSKGEVVQKISKLGNDSLYYSQYFPINRVSEKYYLLSYRSHYTDKKKSLDIVSMDRKGTVQFEASFFTTDDKSEDWIDIRSNIIVGDTLVLLGTYNVGEPLLLNSTSFLMAFDMQMLREGSIVNLKEIVREQMQNTLFPNPTTGQFTLQIPDIKGNAFLQIYNVNGKSVSDEKTVLSGNNDFDITDLPSGTYIYKVYQGNKNLGSGKIVKVD